MNQHHNSKSELRIKGNAHVLGDDVNTDIHCSNKYMPDKDMDYVAQHAFEELDPELIKRFKAGDVLTDEIDGKLLRIVPQE